MVFASLLKKSAQLVLVMAFFSSLVSLEKRPAVQEMKTSIIVPCHYKHFYLLEDLLSHYKMQTLMPDEIVISLSECNQIDPLAMQSLKEKEWPFLIKILPHTEKLSAGQNRNRACSNSSGDILICQDADDIPHPQRVEIIKDLFETYEVDHLMHSWIRIGSSFMNYSSEEWINALACFSDFYTAINSGDMHNGNIAISRNVFKEINWSSSFDIGEDVEFNQKVYERIPHKAILKLPLLMYRYQLSSFRD